MKTINNELNSIVRMIIDCDLTVYNNVADSIAQGYQIEFIANSLHKLLEDEVRGGLNERLAGKLLGGDSWRIVAKNGTFVLLTIYE